MNRDLRQRLIHFLIPYMEHIRRQALIQNALHDCDVLSKISYWERDVDTFTNSLISTLENYGICEGDKESSLITLIRYVGSQHGVDVQKRAEALCEELLQEDGSILSQEDSPALPPPSANPRMRDHIFMSYSHNDRVFVDRLAEDLRRRGHIVWIDFAGIRGGDVWRQSIADGIHASALVLVVISPKALQSEWVALEVNTAKEFGKQLYPLLLEPFTTSSRATYEQLGLESIQYRDFTVGYELALPELLLDLPQPQAGLPGYCQKLIARLAEAPWGLDHYIQERAKLLPIHASPYDEGLKHGTSQNLLKHLWHSKRSIVLGEPGIGKSVALERLAWELASNEPPIVPIIVNLREYDGASLLVWIRLKLLESGEDVLRNALQTSEDTERFLHEMPFTFYLLLDGLNEVHPQHRERILQEIRRISLSYPKHPMVVTSRVQDEGWRELRGGSFDAETVVVQAINSTQAQNYLAAHLEEQDATELWQRLDERMQGLASTPLLLWLIKEAWLETRGKIPGNRGELYANFIERMLRRDDDRKLNLNVTREQRLQALENLALAMHQVEAVSFKRQQVTAIITDEQTLESLLVNGLLQGENIIRFAPHQTVQEHFAARAIQAQVEAELNKPKPSFFEKMANFFAADEVNIFDTAADPWWAETYIQLAGLTNNPNLLAQKIAAQNPWLAWWCVQEGQEVEPETERVIQAQSALLVDSEDVIDRRNAVQALLKLPQARVIEPLAKLAIDPDSSVAEPARQALDELGETGSSAIQDAFNNRLQKLQTPKQRAEYGREIANHDPRKGVGVNEQGLPDIDWVTIPAGEFFYQDDEKVVLPAYKMSRYPVTHVQFQSFVDAEDGYQSQEHNWFEGLHEDAKKYDLSDQRFKYWNHPRETVNWYQAVAFCRWLSYKMGYEIRLPTEYEWEKAARGTDGREYPYEGDFDAQKGNTDETGLRQTSAVGIFPTGASPYGLLDTSGNVFEWCLTDYENPQQKAEVENISSNSFRVLRGGSWSDYGDDARAVSRSWVTPDSRYDFYGFRVCVPLL